MPTMLPAKSTAATARARTTANTKSRHVRVISTTYSSQFEHVRMHTNNQVGGDRGTRTHTGCEAQRILSPFRVFRRLFLLAKFRRFVKCAKKCAKSEASFTRAHWNCAASVKPQVSSSIDRLSVAELLCAIGLRRLESRLQPKRPRCYASPKEVAGEVARRTREAA